MTTGGIPWITGRRRALARSIAVLLVEAQGREWTTLGLAAQSRWVEAVESRMSEWVRRGVAIEYAHPYAGEPVPDTEPAEDAAQEAPTVTPKARRVRR